MIQVIKSIENIIIIFKKSPETRIKNIGPLYSSLNVFDTIIILNNIEF